MSSRYRAVFSVLAWLVSGGLLAAEGGAEWSYEGATGPESWGELSPDYAMCGQGMNQSPIDLRAAYPAELDPLEFDYQSQSTNIVNNGHTLQVNAQPGSSVRIGDTQYKLLQLHFHSPSEHRINGEQFPLEAHFVHQDSEGTLAVVAVLFRAGEWNEDLERIGRAGPTEIGKPEPVKIDFAALDLYRDHDAYFVYNGSLTTPPCSEGIRFHILKSFGTIAPEQAATYVSLIGEDARPPQPLNARIVLSK